LVYLCSLDLDAKLKARVLGNLIGYLFIIQSFKKGEHFYLS